MIFEFEQTYKLQLKTNITYTGQVVKEDVDFVKIKTVRNEELILNKSEIRQILKIEDRTDAKNDKHFERNDRQY